MKWPFGHPLGEPFNITQQRAVLMEMFDALYLIKTPGEIKDVPFRWRKEKYDKYCDSERVARRVFLCCY